MSSGPADPPLPHDIDLNVLPRGVRAELRGLSPEYAEKVGGHLVMAGRLIDEDPAAAYEHAQAARRRAGRLPITREAAAETAYAVGDYASALSDYRALRRMTGDDEYLAVMADCERGLGRPQSALKLVAEGIEGNPPITQRVELRLVEAGARVALDQADEAVRLLRSEIELVGTRGSKLARARLRYAFADLLAARGETEHAEKWFAAAIRLDPEDATGAVDRLARLQGLTIEFDESEELDEDEDGTESDDSVNDLEDGAESDEDDAESDDDEDDESDEDDDQEDDDESDAGEDPEGDESTDEDSDEVEDDDEDSDDESNEVPQSEDESDDDPTGPVEPTEGLDD